MSGWADWYVREYKHLKVPWKEITHATNNFADENIIKSGEYRNMYKGELLLHEVLVTVAIKRVDRTLIEEMFRQEFILSGYRHANMLSPLVGFCEQVEKKEKNEIILVYEFATHRSLDNYLSANLTWLERVQICIDAARGLNNLHNPPGSLMGILHRDLKSANILLEENLLAKLAAPGVLSCFLPENTNLSIGTLCYVDPEYTEMGFLTKESDIYSFGMVLMEVLCGRLAYEEGKPSLGPLACRHYKERKIMEVIDPILKKQMSPDSLDVFSAIAYQCLKRYRNDRPMIVEVVKKLEQALQLQLKFEKALAHPQEEFAQLRIPLDDIKQATNNFADENFIESGEYGKMYKGELLRPGGHITITLKRVKNTIGLGSQAFLKEIMLLSRYRHENIASPVGFCDENNEMMLVHEFATHGGLDRYLSTASLTWLNRVQICLDAARGLNHLHNPTGTHWRVLHSDLKSANILLYKNWHAKIANFSLSNYVQQSQKPTFIISDVAGTLGYVDPLYMGTGILTKESDMYSFGIILLEVLCGRLAFEEGKPSLGPMACHHYAEGKLTDMIDPLLRKQISADSLNVFSATAYQCLKSDRVKRPTISEVVQKLEEVLEYQQKFEKVLSRLQEEFGHLRIPLEDIIQATNNFADENMIASDNYGKIYKGELVRPGAAGVTVAFKRVENTVGLGSLEFLKEIMPLFRYRHENIDFSIGFCDEGNDIIFVHEFAMHRSLDRVLSSANLTWLNRLQICLDVARGLNYLHNPPGTQTRVLHHDLKSPNILLYENWQAKICDLSLSNYLQKNDKDTFHDTNVAATLAYMDPTYTETGILTKESDIYSFGIILMEVLCGRLAYEEGKPSLGPMACRHYKERKLTEIIDPILRKQMSAHSLNAFPAIANQCLKEKQEKRPTIVEIVEKLEEVLGHQQKLEKALELQRVANLKDKREAEDDVKVKNMDYMKIPLEDIKSATQNFDDNYKIGSGGFGNVYKSKLFHFDFERYIKEGGYGTVSMVELSGYPRTQSTVAIKRLDRKFGQGIGEFLQEISVLPYFKHKNLVTLLGFCDEDDERILVYDYASNGSLDSHIESNDIMTCHTWATRLQICLDAAYGLEFLHNGVGEHHRIIHRDIKSSNILLGQNYRGMISDFGLSKIAPANVQATFLITRVVGTVTYVDPQYYSTGTLTKKSDVYSFGVVLFEALSGRLAYVQMSKNSPEFLPHMAKRCFEENKVNEIIDSKFKKEFERAGSSILNDKTCPESIMIFATIAYKCCKEKRVDRPTMADVVRELERAFNSHVDGIEALRTTLHNVMSATNDFRDIKEKGTLGKVYSGEFSHIRGQKTVPRKTVTIKRLHRSVDLDGETFSKKIARLHSYSHENVVPVLAFCEEQGERIAVFEHFLNGSLKEHLTNTSLTWKQRLKICLDAASGLRYIHSYVELTKPLTHGDIKSSSIVLGNDWKAAISDFIIFKGSGTLGYLDPFYMTTGSLTQKSDVYSFGVILFEILSGRLAFERIKNIDQQPKNVEPQQTSARGTGEEERVVFLAQLAAKCFKNQKIEDIIFHGIKDQIEPNSLEIFSKIANQCLLEQPEDRPTMAKVVEELEKACQDEWEWEQKLPTDYKEIIQMSKCPVPSTISKKDLHSLFSSGILLNDEKVWFSISMDGLRNEMVSAQRFSYKDISSVMWRSRSIKKSRFPKVAKIFDILNLNVRIQIDTELLTPEVMYGAYLVFKFCDRRKVSTKPIYVNLKYKKAGETLNAYFAERKEGGGQWLRVELFRFLSKEGSNDFEALLESFSKYYCGTGGIFVEGIEFQAVRTVDLEQNKEVKDGTKVGVVLKTQLGMDSTEQMISNNREIIKRFGNDIQYASKAELYLLLSKGMLIDKGEKFFLLSEVNGKRCHMLPAKAVICKSSNVKLCKPPTKSRCRFAEVVEILSHQDFHIKCDIETQLLSLDTIYACYLVFKLSEKCQGLKCPVKVRELLPHKKQRTKIISFTTPNTTLNLEKIKWIPEQREDGWTEVVVWETIFDSTHNKDYVPMDLKVTCYEGNMSGLIVHGIEFRPIA